MTIILWWWWWQLWCEWSDCQRKLLQVLRCRCTEQGHEFWVSKSKCLNWSFLPDLNVSPSKRLRKIARDLQAHNFGALSDRMDVLRKMLPNLNIPKVLRFEGNLKSSCREKSIWCISNFWQVCNQDWIVTFFSYASSSSYSLQCWVTRSVGRS